MIIETKVNLGDLVWVISQGELKYTPCTVCNNERTIIYKGEKFYCPKCHGTGTFLEEKRPYEVAFSGKVHMIKLQRSLKNVNAWNFIVYSVLETGKRTAFHDKNEKYVFTSEESALEECKRLNELEKK